MPWELGRDHPEDTSGHPGGPGIGGGEGRDQTAGGELECGEPGRAVMKKMFAPREDLVPNNQRRGGEPAATSELPCTLRTKVHYKGSGFCKRKEKKSMEEQP